MAVGSPLEREKDTEQLYRKAGRIAEIILFQIRECKNINIISHFDVDGIVSASLMAKSVTRRKGQYTVRITSDLNRSFLQTLPNNDFHVVCDLGSRMADKLNYLLGSSWIALDHHEIRPEERSLEHILNPWQFDIDGGVEICSGGIAYLVASKMDESNKDLAWMAVVSALGDKQDQGRNHSLIGLNRTIVDDAIHSGRLRVDSGPRMLYFLENEQHSLREAREFAALLDACGRSNKSEVGVRLLLGDRGNAFVEGQAILKLFKGTLDMHVQSILSDPSRVTSLGRMIVISGKSLFNEEMLGAVATRLMGSTKFEDKILLLGTETQTEEVKFVLRLGKSIKIPLNLGRLVVEAAGLCGGIGGGQNVSANARIPIARANKFIRLIQNELGESK